MKKLILIAFLLIVVSCVTAVEMDQACISKGYNYTVSNWQFDKQYINVNTLEPYSILVWGGANKANWTSNYLIDGVVYKTGTRTYLLPGGFNGTVPKTTTTNDIVYITFCKNSTLEDIDGSKTLDVPEFSVITLMIALVIATSIILRKRSVS